MHGVTGSPFYMLSIGNILLLINVLIFFRVDFNQAFLTSAGNIVSSEKFLGSGIKFDTFETDYTKVVNEIFISFTTDLKNLCKTLPILFADSSDTLHSF